MKAKYFRSLRFKIVAGLLFSLVVVLAIASYLHYVSFQHLLVQSLQDSGATNAQEIVRAQMTAYLRSGLVLSVSSVIVILLIGERLMTRVVVSRLKRFLQAVKQVGAGHHDTKVTVEGDDELAELAKEFNDVTQDLRWQTEELAALNALAITVSQSLDLDEVLCSALDEVLALTELKAAWIILRDDSGADVHLVASRGLPENVASALTQCNWDRCVCSGVFESGQSQVFRIDFKCSCVVTGHLEGEGLVSRACVPLRSKERVQGVMSLAGDASNHRWMFTEDALETLTAIGRQIGVAVENANLYQDLRQEEQLRRQLLERVIEIQEQERRRIARELHDQTGQRLTSVFLTLGILEEAVSTPEAQAPIRDLQEMTAQILREVRNLALELRPSVLDDLGLLAALRNYLRRYQSRFRLFTDFQVLGLDGKRLPSEVETALFRITQEALTNVAQHAQAHRVTILLEDRGTSIMLIVEDDGVGFDVAHVMNAHPHEHNLGLYGMRERAFLLGGTLTIESTPGRGTTVFVRIPLEREQGDDGQNPPVGG
jgi:signal transduction histidine kinase